MQCGLIGERTIYLFFYCLSPFQPSIFVKNLRGRPDRGERYKSIHYSKYTARKGKLGRPGAAMHGEYNYVRLLI